MGLYTHQYDPQGKWVDTNGNTYHVIAYDQDETANGSFVLDVGQGLTGNVRTRPWVKAQTPYAYAISQGLALAGPAIAAADVYYDPTCSQIGNTNDNVQDTLCLIDAAIADLRTQAGLSATGLGFFTTTPYSVVDPLNSGTQTTKGALQELDTEAVAARVLTGTAKGDTDLGTFTGDTISDNVDIKTAFQEIEIALEAGTITTWATGVAYAVDQFVVDPVTLKLYRANTAHTSTTDLATDIANWTEISGTAFTGATTAAAGTGGDVPVPAQDQQNKVLKGDGTWGDVVTDFNAGANYEVGDLFLGADGTLFRATAAIAAGSQATAEAAEAAAVATPLTTPSNIKTQAAAYTAVASDNIFADTSGAAFAVTLPLTPAIGDTVRIIDATGSFGTNNLTINGNGNNVEGAATAIASIDYGIYELHFTGTEWVVQQEAEATANMTGATTAAAGTAGSAPAPPQDSQNRFLRGDATYGPSVPAWTTGVNYEVGDIVYDPNTNNVYRNIAATTPAGATFAADIASWQILSGGFTPTATQVGPVYAAAAWDSVNADTTGASFTVTLPATPQTGDRIEVIDQTGQFATNPLTVSGNGNNVEGGATKDLHTAYGVYEFVFDGTQWTVQGEQVSVVSRDGTTGQYTHSDGDGTDVAIAPFTGASAITDGLIGDVVQPLTGQTGRFLRATGIWDNPQDVVFSALVVDNAGSPWTPDVLTFLLAQTATGAVTIDLPTTMVDLSPLVDGVRMAVADIDGNASTNNITINGNGNNINGAAAPFVISVDDALFELVWDDATNSWYAVTPGQVLASTSVFIDGTEWVDQGDGRIGLDITGTPFADYSSGAIVSLKEALDYIDEKIKVFKGTDGVTDGEVGIVPRPLAASNDNLKFLRGDGTWANASLPLSASYTAAATVVANEAALVDTTGGAFTLALPAAPAAGDRIEIIDHVGNFATDNLTINGAGNNIEGNATYTASTDWGVYELIFDGTQWIVQGEASGGAVMGAATTLAGGTQGEVPAPLVDEQNQFLRGDGTWDSSIPSWVTTRDYEVDDVVYDPTDNLIYRCITAHTSGATLAADAANWTELSPSTGGAVAMGGATTAAAGSAGLATAPPQDSQNQFLRGDATYGPAIPAWVTGTDYELGDIVYDPATELVYRCSTANAAPGATLVADIANWTEISPAGGSVFTGATDVLAGTAGTVPQPAAGDNDAFLKGDAQFHHLYYPTQIEDSTDVGAEAGRTQRKLTYPDASIRYVVDSQTYSAGVTDGIVRIYDGDAATLLYTMTKANATGIITIA